MQIEIKPPKKEYDLDLEMRALGATMHSPVMLKGVLRELSEEDFTHGLHRNLFKFIKEQDELGLPVDQARLTVGAKALYQDPAGAFLFVNDLYQAAPMNYELWNICRQLKHMTVHRKAWSLVQSAVNSKDDGDEDATAKLYEALKAARDIVIDAKPGPVPLSQTLSAFIATMEESLLGVRPVAYSTGFDAIDKIFKYMPQCLYVFGGRPGMGKTAWAFGQALVMGRQGLRVLFVSKEMSAEQLMQRLVTAKTGIPGAVIRDGYLSEKEVAQAKEVLREFEEGKYNVDIVDSGINTPEDIRAWLDAAPEGKPYHAVYLDYLQLLGGGNDKASREQIVGDNSWKCKEIAKEYNIPFIALAQLSRNLTQRQEKRPNLGDLRESGRLEQDADVVGFIHRDDYYEGASSLIKDKENNMVFPSEFIVAKHRHGGTGTAHIGFCPSRTVFTNLKPEDENKVW